MKLELLLSLATLWSLLLVVDGFTPHRCYRTKGLAGYHQTVVLEAKRKRRKRKQPPQPASAPAEVEPKTEISPAAEAKAAGAAKVEIAETTADEPSTVVEVASSEFKADGAILAGE